jgi:hypothetical protein
LLHPNVKLANVAGFDLPPQTSNLIAPIEMLHSLGVNLEDRSDILTINRKHLGNITINERKVAILDYSFKFVNKTRS